MIITRAVYNEQITNRNRERIYTSQSIMKFRAAVTCLVRTYGEGATFLSNDSLRFALQWITITSRRLERVNLCTRYTQFLPSDGSKKWVSAFWKLCFLSCCMKTGLNIWLLRDRIYVWDMPFGIATPQLVKC